MIQVNQEGLSIQNKCSLLALPLSTYYYKPAAINPLNLMLMKIIDQVYTRYPYYGVRRMTHWINKYHSEFGPVNHKRVANLMQIMGLQGIYPKKKFSQPNKENVIYTYLLRNLCIEYPNQVWATDITYILMIRGFCYLVAVVDWYTRYIISWSLSITLEIDFCIQALQKALQQSQPEIFNSDQGTQFTSNQFTQVLKNKGIQISMDSRGRAFDNIMIERFM